MDRSDHPDATRAAEELADRPLGSLLAPPEWLRHLGMTSWMVAGIALVTTAAIGLAALTQTIVMPVVAAAVIAAVASPVVGWLQRHGVSRAIAAILLLLAVMLIAVGVAVLVIGAVLSESGALSTHLASAKDTLTGWLGDAGVSQSEAQEAKQDVDKAVRDAVPALLGGLVQGIGALSSFAFFLVLMALSLVFLLKDGPMIRDWAERHAGVPAPIAHIVAGRMLQSLRGYFVGVTAVAAFNAVVVGVGALVLGVPLPGTIAIVTFVGAYVPYLGAWAAGAFAVLIALGGAGTEEAIAIAILSLLANGILQQMVQPIAYGAALGIHPLAVLIVTIAGGSLFGAVGLILAAPLTSAATRIAGDLGEIRGRGESARPDPAEAQA